ncbi:DUF4199 domain-containing protein [Dysgonomonas sp. 25]|uniref:DUF4199 domain-containing protein n=1 Tax=Dysgonomonas sp. 25 TaxID=2302933 RepID=UPI0013D8542B|nr:DUF4199 domain-containing protein [Dysgonomonas sp. 25]NDV68908.1 DUF4199 domain-containing protein [Dysgonomonas sp. 25]
MKEKNTLIRNLLLRYGAIIGAFWVFKYLFLIGSGFTDHVFIYIYYILNIGTFLLIYIYYFKLRKISDSLWRCLKMMMLICFIGSLVEGVVMLLHYTVIHPEYFSAKVTFLPQMFVETVTGDETGTSVWMRMVSSKSFYIITNVIGKVFVGSFLTLAIALFSNNKRKQVKE